MIERELLEILCCPETHQPLRPAPPEVIARLAAAIPGGSARTVAGEPVTAPVSSGLLREDGAVLYPTRDGIPILLVEEGIRVGL